MKNSRSGLSINAYISSIFLYNCEIWTITRKLENTIDSFQRKQLRRILKIRWPKKIRNEELYKRTEQIPWSTTIKRRRLNWLGHLMRLNENTPARLAFEEFLRKGKKPKGRPPLTWPEIIRKDLAEINIKLDYNNPLQTIETLLKITQDRDQWRDLVRGAVLHM